MKLVDAEISNAELHSLQQHNATLIKQNNLFKQELAQLKTRQANTSKELTVYKNIVIKNSTDVDVLELQHQRIE